MEGTRRDNREGCLYLLLRYYLIQASVHLADRVKALSLFVVGDNGELLPVE